MLRLPRIAASRALPVAYVLLLSTIICSYFLFTEARISGFSVIQGTKVIKVIIYMLLLSSDLLVSLVSFDSEVIT
jgi:hypothetical protein